ncbi:SAE2 domain-containing protein [Mycena sanguinolenta]|uniref:SAE2 domain-containing protein n=1 Tax=Mycena sanguinolenta TaxID=230812 RepID=A0A8H6ZCH0_9AGAR|nr:SAE2 domain-containing protein [Mycena sanguinolenta]
MSYKELLGRIAGFQTDLSKERKANKELLARVQGLTTERDALKTKVSDSAILSPLNATHHSKSEILLQRRYDDLLAAKLSAEARYEADYRKFRALKAYMDSAEIQDLEAQYKIDLPHLTKDEKTRRRGEILALFEKKAQDIEAGENSKEEIMLGDNNPIAVQSDKENQKTPVPAVRKRLVSQSPRLPLSPVGVLFQSTPKVQPAEPLPAASSSRTLAPNPRSHVPSKPQPPTGIILIPSSSDTEEPQHPDSDPFPIEAVPFINPARPVSSMSMSETEDDSSQEFRPPPKPPSIPVKAPPPTQEDLESLIKPSVSHNLNPRMGDRSASSRQPDSLQLVDQRPKSKTRHSDSDVKPSIPAGVTSKERPTKKRRLSSPGPGPSSARRVSMDKSATSVAGTSAATALYVSEDTPSPPRRQDKDRSASTGRKVKGIVKDSGKGKQRELFKTLTKTPVHAQASSSKQLADYSAYKGRGRYATDNTDGNTTINANFTIDPARNGGKNFQYDEVVRGRADRQRMEAGDCECCRDYYQQIGPMPPRLQAPLWRTPPSSPHESKPCLRTESAPKESADITSHKQTISRHRHHWAPASTPPSYWSIGFPNTQEVVSINEKAREMHQQKQKIVQEEANKDGGRFKKR